MLIPAAPDTAEVEVEDGYGFVILEVLSRKGWSLVITTNHVGGVRVEADRDGETIRESGPSVDWCAPRVFHKAMGFRVFAA